MIKNDIYTYDYFQPKEYRFSLDSVFLTQKVASLIRHRSDLSAMHVLDLCSGCGIIGLELSLHVKELMQIDFLEVQKLYLEYFDQNVAMIHPDTDKKLRFLNLNYAELTTPKFKETYDIIVCNPPYFFKDEGLLSPNDFKNRCRFFIDSDFDTLIKGIRHALKPHGAAYVLMRSGNHHGRNPIAAIQEIVSAKIVDDVRGTHVVEIRKEVE